MEANQGQTPIFRADECVFWAFKNHVIEKRLTRCVLMFYAVNTLLAHQHRFYCSMLSHHRETLLDFEAQKA